MRQLLFVMLLLLSASALAMAQETPAAEAFGGYSYLRCDSGGSNTSCNLNGWNGSVAFNANKVFGIVADFSGHYGKVESVDVKAHSFLFGPRLSARTEKATPFAHALFGVTRIKFSEAGFNESNNFFAMALGGGLDFNVGRIAIRPVQLEYFMTRDEGETGNHLRYSAGIIFKLGSR